VTSQTRPWWATWWAVAAWFVLAALAVLPAVFGWLLYAFYPIENQAGIDMRVDSGPPAALRWAAAVAALAFAALPVLVARWARKAWLGYLLLGALLCIVVLAVGLWMFGIL
jgi:hypothetical protein